MKKLTLNQTWKYCLVMWKWIAGQIEQGSTSTIDTLKAQWLRRHPRFGEIYNNCFFCEYLNQHPTNKKGDCPTCPGRLVNRQFNCMDNATYNFGKKPLEFYAKLLELDKKRKKK